MKKITLLFALSIFSLGYSQTAINFDANSTDGTGWIGFMNVSDNPKDGNVGDYQFGSGWGVPDLVVDVDGANNTATLKPNRIGDTAEYWQTAGVLEGNKLMQAAFYIEDDALGGVNFTFNANVTNGLNSDGLSFPFQVRAYIQVFAPDYSAVLASIEETALANGDVSLAMDATAYTNGEHVQYGFEVFGPNINSDASFDTAYDAFGGILIQPATLNVEQFETNNFSVYPNPSTSKWNISAMQNISQVQLFNVLGKQVMSLSPNSNTATIDNSNLPAGIYFAKMYSDNGGKTIKLIKN